MPLPRRRWLAAACVAIIVLALVARSLWPEPADARRAWDEFERIRPGMTPNEVAAIFGPDDVFPPPGYVLNGQVAITEFDPGWRDCTEMVSRDRGPYLIMVCFKDRRAVCKRVFDLVPWWNREADRWFHRLRGLVGL